MLDLPIQQKLKLVKQYFKGWGFNLQREFRKKRKEISEDLTKLEAIEEVDGLSNEQVIRKIWLVKENLALLNKTGATNLGIKYLGVPVSPSRLHVEDWLPLIEKNAKNLMFGKVEPCPLLADQL